MGCRKTRHRITIRGTGEMYMCSENQHLLKGMAAMGKRGIPSGCHGGGCGVCKVRVIGDKNAYETLPMSREHISEAEETKGIVLACRTYPRDDLEVEVLGKIKKNALKKGGGWAFGQPVPSKASDNLSTGG